MNLLGRFFSGTFSATLRLSAVAVLLVPVTAAAQVLSSVLPVSRSGMENSSVTVYATMINGGPSSATGCRITLPAGAPAGVALQYQTTDPATNRVTGTPNTPVTLAVGVPQSFLVTLTFGKTPFDTTDLPLSFVCSNSPPAAVTPGVNTVLVSNSCVGSPVADVVALAATPANDGIANISRTSGTGAFAVASVNVGANDTVTVTADTGNSALPVALSLCQTNPTTGACLQPASGSVTTPIANGATPTFGVFVRGTGGAVPFDPARNRVFVRFREASGKVRGATSVAVRTQ